MTFDHSWTIDSLKMGRILTPGDRIRVGDEYRLQRSGTRYLDTMSLHIATAGMTSSQRLVRLNTVHMNSTYNRFYKRCGWPLRTARRRR